MKEVRPQAFPFPGLLLIARGPIVFAAGDRVMKLLVFNQVKQLLAALPTLILLVTGPGKRM